MSPVQKYFDTIKTGRSAWWHWLIGTALIVVAFIAIAIPIVFIYAEVPSSGLGDLAFLFATFLPLFFGIWLVQKFWHKRTLTQLLTYTSKFRWRYFWNSIGVTAIVFAVWIAAISLIWPEEWAKYQRNPNMDLVLYGGLITLLLVPFQAASEEFLLRGYLNQALIKYLKSPWVVFVITSAAFAWLHIWNPEAKGQEIPYLIAIFSFGFAACILLYFEGGLESAIGLHIANNFIVFAIIGYEDPDLPTTALYFSGQPVIGMREALLEVVFLAILTPAILWLNRRYRVHETEDNDIWV